MDRSFSLAGLLPVLFLLSCNSGNGDHPKSCAELVSANQCSIVAQNQCVHETMLEHYLWYRQVPARINYEDFESPAETLDFLRYADPGPDSGFSYVDTEQAFDTLFEAGQYVGFGFSFISDRDGRLWVRFVYDDSAAGEADMRRGDEIISINGQQVTALTLNPGWTSVFGDDDDIGLELQVEVARNGDSPITITLQKGIVNINSVLHHSVINASGKAIGYLLYSSFLTTSRSELQAVFADFSNAGVEQVILDLRYNSGGSIAVANQLASYFNPDQQQQRVFNQVLFNDKNSSSNQELLLSNDVDNLPALEKLLVITSSQTCSASEMLINGLSPYMDVQTMGGATCGKPVGMSPHFFCGTALLPVTFELKNSNGEGDYYEGIAADCDLTDNRGVFNDDYDFAWGDTSAPVLSAAIDYASTGACAVARKPQSSRLQQRLQFANPLRAIAGAI